MKSVEELLNSKMKLKGKKLKDSLLDLAKMLTENELESKNLKLETFSDFTDWSYSELTLDLINEKIDEVNCEGGVFNIWVTLAATPISPTNNGKGDYKTWFVLLNYFSPYFLNEYEEWLESYGWSLDIEPGFKKNGELQEISMLSPLEVRIYSGDLSTGIINPKTGKFEENFLDKYDKLR